MEVEKPRLRKQTALILAAILLAFSLFSAFLYFNTSPDPNYPSASKPKSNNSQDGASSSTPVPSSSKAASHQDPASTRSRTNNNTKTNINTDPSTTKAFTFVAQPGDSYTLFARQAIASYLAQNQISATDQQKLIAEINLTNSAGAPYLEIGDKISIQSSDIVKQFTSATAASTSSVASDDRSAASDATSQTKSAHSSSKTSSKSAHSLKTSPESDQPGSYTFTAQSGDSYITLARQAIQQSQSGAKLSPAQKVAAETKLAAVANWPAINLGQTVTINATDLKQAIDFAINLSPAELSAWQPFADLIVW